MTLPTVGLIVPPAAGAVPPGGPALYPGVHFAAAGLGLTELTPDGYDGVIDDVARLAAELAAGGADAVSLMGTSLSFYRGTDFNATLTARMAAETGLPTTTMSTAIDRGLAAVGARRVAVATAYGDVVTDRLRGYLEALGYVITASTQLGVRSVEAVFAVGDEQIVDTAQRAIAAGGNPDALLISCGGLDTLNLIDPLEGRLGIPVVASSPAGYWDAVQLVGIDPRVSGHGQLLATAPKPPVHPVLRNSGDEHRPPAATVR